MELIQGDAQALQPNFLNTSFMPELAGLAIPELFARTRPLGRYSVLSVELEQGLRTSVQQDIVFDSNWDWLTEKLKQKYPHQPEYLPLNEILQFHRDLSKSSSSPIENFTQTGRQKLSENGRQLHYLDELRVDNFTRPLTLALALQFLIERHTGYESRLVKARVRHIKEATKGFFVLLISEDKRQARILDPSGDFPQLNGREISRSESRLNDEVLGAFYFETLQRELRITQPSCAWDEKSRMFSLFGDGGRELSFKVLGRSPAEKRFKKEQEQIQQASAQESVPIEIGFHPFWRRLGHTTLRIGESLYELSAQGWKAHSNGADTARAYLFNNPFFKTQFQKYRYVGMPPISIAVTLMVPKATAEALWISLENLAAAQGRAREKFSLYWNNCNHGIMRELKAVGLPGFEPSGYMGFSSVLSFRKILLDAQLKVQGCYIYPLPGIEIGEDQLRRWVPKLIYRQNSVAQEMRRAIPSLAWDALIFVVDRIGKLTFKIFGLKAWRQTMAYYLR